MQVKKQFFCINLRTVLVSSNLKCGTSTYVLNFLRLRIKRFFPLGLSARKKVDKNWSCSGSNLTTAPYTNNFKISADIWENSFAENRIDLGCTYCTDV